MSFFHKNERVPELPPAERGGIKNPPKEENMGLPSLPKNLGAGLNREIVKSAVSDDSEDLSASVLESLEEKEDLIPSVPQEKIPERVSIYSQGDEKPLFVRIDKFQDAKKDLKEIDKKIKVVEASLRKLNEVKMREDKEISELMVGLNSVKEKISKVDSNIFEKI